MIKFLSLFILLPAMVLSNEVGVDQSASSVLPIEQPIGGRKAEFMVIDIPCLDPEREQCQQIVELPASGTIRSAPPMFHTLCTQLVQLPGSGESHCADAAPRLPLPPELGSGEVQLVTDWCDPEVEAAVQERLRKADAVLEVANTLLIEIKEKQSTTPPHRTFLYGMFVGLGIAGLIAAVLHRV